MTERAGPAIQSDGERYLAARITGLPVFTEFAAFMARVKHETPNPALRDIDLMSEYRLARNIYIFDIHEGTPTFWIRYVGKSICNFFGFDTTGRYLESLDFVENFEETVAGYRTIVREKAPYAFLNYIAFEEERLSEFKKGHQFVMIRLSFPITDTEGRVVNIVGAMDFIDVEEAPRERFVQLPYAAICPSASTGT